MLRLTEDQTLLTDGAHAAIGTQAPIADYRRLRGPSGEGFSREFWRKAADLGWSGVLVPEEAGGAPFGIVGAGLLARELSRTLSLSPFLSTAVLAATALAEGGSPEQRETWLPRIARAEAIVALAHEEGQHPLEGRPATRAEQAGAGYRLDGVKSFALEGHAADALIVSATLEGATVLFLVETNARGLSRQTRVLLDGRRVATVRLDGVEIGADARLPGDALDRTLDVGRAVLAASLCGVVEEAMRRTLDYLKERRQFERRIGSFQALQHRAAIAYVAAENAWSATLAALQALDARADDATFHVAVAKSKASRAAVEVTAECLQMHGGIGMTDEYDIGLYLKRARVEATLFGDAAWHADRVAAWLGY